MKLTTPDYEMHVEEFKGYCSNCDDLTAEGVEGDATLIECCECGKNTVMGIENALIEGHIEVIDEREEELEKYALLAQREFDEREFDERESNED